MATDVRADFDAIATHYDGHFTHSVLGLAQREQVWKQLENLLPKDQKLDILEFNCGTGEDALKLARLGHQVLATDVSREMIEVARLKAKNTLTNKPAFDVLSLTENELPKGPFDLIFSNFGGLNCLSPAQLKTWSQKIQPLLKPNGRAILVLMPRFCFWESLYFLLTLKPQKAFRRWSKKKQMANLGGSQTATWYHAPSFFKKQFGKQVGHLCGIGIALPPSYLEPRFKNAKNFLAFLKIKESFLAKIPAMAYLSDHYLIEIKAP